MAENREYAPRILAPGEKPVLNEKYIIPLPEDSPAAIPSVKMPARKIPAEKTETAPEMEKAGKKSLRDENLREGVRLFTAKLWEQALCEFLLINTDNLNNEERPELAYYLGLCCAKLEKYEDAVPYLEQYAAAGGDSLRVYQCRMTVAYIYIKTGRLKMAEFELKRLQNGGFESAMVCNTLGYTSYAQKRYMGAIDFYEKALEIDPNNATAMNCLGYILADKGIDTEKALHLCRRAAETQPQNPAYLDSLGWAHYKCREISEAKNCLRKALDLAPQVKEIREHFRIVSGGLG
jgi:tetratricopeptide (TPR) repeat protein